MQPSVSQCSLWRVTWCLVIIAVSLLASSWSSTGSRYTTGCDMQLFLTHKNRGKVICCVSLLGLSECVLICVYMSPGWVLFQQHQTSLRSFQFWMGSAGQTSACKRGKRRERRDMKDTAVQKQGKAWEAWNSPALLSLELVGSSKNVAKSSAWLQVQKAFWLRRKCEISILFCMFEPICDLFPVKLGARVKEALWITVFFELHVRTEWLLCCIYIIMN